ncbi:hypothetical protein [Streptomyces melanogenes]|uniref:hypothetical protein n=1 Tax=Streptomyces melanogenes TaxID=67326 RepID=UPI00167DB574|nr:hypothetical protein [Streptomyces melanogenes]GGP71919.1 hypothetical protein GCM10010278_57350 [Streptomyces melanogenes]
MTSDPISTARTSPSWDDVAELITLIRTVGPWVLVGWRPRGGFAHRDEVDLRAVEAGLRRKL